MNIPRLLVCTAAAALLSASTVQATPYASGVTNAGGNGTLGGNIHFILNEPADNVYVIFGDGTSNAIASPGTAGAKSFPLGSETSFSIYCVKNGTGAISEISSDSNPLNSLGSPRGVAVSQNPQNWRFGRTYMDNAVTGNRGIFMRNADQSDSVFGQGTTTARAASIPFVASTYSPFRLYVGPDGTVYVSSTSTVAGGGFLGYADGDISTGGLALTGAYVNYATGENHTDVVGTPQAFGSISNGNLTLYAYDANYPPGSAIQMWNVGAGPFPSSVTPTTVAASGFGVIGVLVSDNVTTSNYIYLNCDRSNPTQPNLGEPALQIFTNTASPTLVWDSYNNSIQYQFDLFTNLGGIAVSPDGQYLAMGNLNGFAYIAKLTNGIPDETTIVQVPGNGGGSSFHPVCWDAADNFYSVANGPSLLKVYSLGLNTTCVTSNDYTGTNGSFAFIPPSLTASVVNSGSAIAYQANHSYTGSPSAQPAVFNVFQNTTTNIATAINFTLTGTATNVSNYIVTTNGTTVTPVGSIYTVSIGAGQTNILVTITPTTSPAVGPSMTVILTVKAGAAYSPALPTAATISIANSGEQTLTITPGGAPTMYRGLPNDFVSFVVTRWGDTNVSWTIPPSTFTLTGTASFGAGPTADYSAGPQPAIYTTAPIAGSGAGTTVNAGDLTETIEVGLPRTHLSYTGSKTIIVSGTGGSSPITFAFNTNTATMTLLDNLYPPEYVLWSDPLTDPNDSTNWNVVFSANTGTYPYQFLMTNYTGTPTNDTDNSVLDFDANFGYGTGLPGGVSNDSLLPPPSGATNALRVTCNKNGNDTNLYATTTGGVQGSVGPAAGVNLYPNNAPLFQGNYALRFSMAMVHDCGGTTTESVLFGINHYGTNVNWILGSVVQSNSPQGVFSFTNSDGTWFSLDSDVGQLSANGFSDIILGTGTNGNKANSFFPSTGWWAVDGVTWTGFTNVFKYSVDYDGDAAGAIDAGVPQNISGWAGDSYSSYTCPGTSVLGQWIDVDVEQSNNVITLYMNKTKMLAYTNATIFTNGTIMLGYTDPYAGQGFGGGAYFSGVRVVGLGPDVTNSPASVTVGAGTNASFTLGALGSAPFVNQWYFGTNLIPANLVKSDTKTTPQYSDSDSLAIPSAVSANAGTYTVVVTDASGYSVISTFVLTVVNPPVISVAPANATNFIGTSVTFSASTNSGIPPFLYSWTSNATSVAGATNSSLTLSNLSLAQSGNYVVKATNFAGANTALATLTVLPAPSPKLASPSTTGSGVTFQFNNGGDTANTTNSFNIQASVNLSLTNEGFTNITPQPPITLTGTNFTVTVPTNGSQPDQYFRVQHK